MNTGKKPPRENAPEAPKREKTVSEREEEILKFWEEHGIFEKTLEKMKKGKPFIFYEGPPTANGMPGIHHIEARAFKDIITRYKTMRGFFVPRKAGWDTHGLPVEIQVEKELGFTSKQDIENYGIAKFNARAKESVWRYKGEWERLTKRMGYWLDLAHPYITYETSYIESLWWIIKQFSEKGFLYEDFKVLPWCPRCGTALSSHEVGLGYQEDTDTAVYAGFRIRSNDSKWRNTYIVSWTTTPWTLPGNVGLAVNPKLTYIRLRIGPEYNARYIVVAKERAKALRDVLKISGEGEIIEGKDLIGLAYEPLFSIPQLQNEKSHKIYAADFVTAEDGTGVVHTAVMYGEDDYRLGNAVGLPKFHTVAETGRFIPELGDGLAGKYAKDKATEDEIIKFLEEKNLLFAKEEYKHEYPHCWRCATPLLYYARNAWWVRTTAVKEKLLEENERINWMPEHLKHGRFGEFLRDLRDWAFSRERYWGTPIPVWKCLQCRKTHVIGSLEELRARVPTGRNRYILMRHGESDANIKNIVSITGEEYALTSRGERQAERAAEKLKKESVDFIYSSPVRRTKETAEIMAEKLGIPKKNRYTDARLREINAGDFNGRAIKEYHAYFSDLKEKFTKRPPGKNAENLRDVQKRVREFMEEMERAHEGKTILVISHEYPLWMAYAAGQGLTDEEAVLQCRGKEKSGFMAFAELKRAEYREMPRNGEGEVDLHRPHIDAVAFACESCGGRMERTPEIADVWFDSGAMPFAQAHYPFALAQNQKSKIKNRNPRKELPFPADYISEAIDQTRGWFYTLLATATLLGKGTPYKNVISLGHVLDKDGKKMSKSKGNIVNPWDMIEKFGIDALRWYFYTINAPGDSKRFDEKDIQVRYRNFIGTFWNSFVFFDTYAERIRSREAMAGDNKNFLDGWMLLRLNQLVKQATENLEEYDVVAAARAIEQCIVHDFSQWYVKHSRRRLQNPETRREKGEAAATMGAALEILARLAAPFAPFIAEEIWQGLRKKMPLKEESVHLAGWPSYKKRESGAETHLLNAMASARNDSVQLLRMRLEAGIPLRQPLASLRRPKYRPMFAPEADELLKQVVNVKNVLEGKEMALDTVLTRELEEEGAIRELMRNVQDMRKECGLTPQDAITLFFEAEKPLGDAVRRWEAALLRGLRAKEIQQGRRKAKSEREISFEAGKIWVGIK